MKTKQKNSGMFSRILITTLPFVFVMFLIMLFLLQYINIMNYKKIYDNNLIMLFQISWQRSFHFFCNTSNNIMDIPFSTHYSNPLVE